MCGVDVTKKQICVTKALQILGVIQLPEFDFAVCALFIEVLQKHYFHLQDTTNLLVT